MREALILNVMAKQNLLRKTLDATQLAIVMEVSKRSWLHAQAGR